MSYPNLGEYFKESSFDRSFSKLCKILEDNWEFFLINILIDTKEKIPGMNNGCYPLLTAGVFMRFEVLKQ
jgi:hypothetical protein